MTDRLIRCRGLPQRRIERRRLAIFNRPCYTGSIGISGGVFCPAPKKSIEDRTVCPARAGQAEWGENPREWVTVMRACRAQSDTSEPDLCSCRHRESMDEFFVRTAGGCADFLSGAFPPPESAVRKAAQPMCFPGRLRRSPSAVCCQQKEPPSALGTAEGGFFAMK